MLIIIPVLYATSMLVLLAYGVNLLWLSRKYCEIDAVLDGPVPEPDQRPTHRGPWPAVTVQLPIYNEAYVVERLIDACASLDYPRHSLEIQILDDSTDETTDLAASRTAYWSHRGVNIVHVRRTDREGYKAGALQNGLRIAAGDLIAIFDADFVPEPDYLRRVVPVFDSENIGMVQARWGHLNDRDSLLTRIQAFALDAHFALEHRVRQAVGCFINFNGTAGVWRRECIEDAGGWTSDTLTEDLDLSYRAQLNGWKFRYLEHVEVGAELPVDMNAFRSQQFRWTKGAVQTAFKMLPRLWGSDFPRTVKLEGTVQLTAHLVFPFILLAALLHAPLVLMKSVGSGPGEWFFATMGLGLVGFGGFFLGQLFAQRALYPDWPSRLKVFPWFMAGSMGLSVNNSRAVWQALRGHRTPFVRTPKYSSTAARPWWKSRYAVTSVPRVVWLELLMMAYCIAGLVLIAVVGEWPAMPFQVLFAFGFGLVGFYSLRLTSGIQRWERPPSPRLRRLMT